MDEARDWLVRAERDVEVARKLAGGIPAFPDAVAFHAQQAVEKSLKAFLAAHGQVFPRTHELGSLLARCTAIEPAFQPLVGRVEPLTPYAVRFRYPGGPVEPPLEEALAALEVALEAMQLARSLLP